MRWGGGFECGTGPHFAWWPIRLIDGRWAWLEFVHRRAEYVNYGRIGWVYEAAP